MGARRSGAKLQHAALLGAGAGFPPGAVSVATAEDWATARRSVDGGAKRLDAWRLGGSWPLLALWRGCRGPPGAVSDMSAWVRTAEGWAEGWAAAGRVLRAARCSGPRVELAAASLCGRPGAVSDTASWR